MEKTNYLGVRGRIILAVATGLAALTGCDDSSPQVQTRLNRIGTISRQMYQENKRNEAIRNSGSNVEVKVYTNTRKPVNRVSTMTRREVHQRYWSDKDYEDVYGVKKDGSPAKPANRVSTMTRREVHQRYWSDKDYEDVYGVKKDGSPIK
jgi:hypothetical protein